MRALLAVAILVFATDAHAQLGGLSDRVRRAAAPVVDRMERTPAEPEVPTPATGWGSAPAVDAHSLLHVAFAPTRGTFFTNEDLIAVFPSESGTYALVVLGGDGSEIARQGLVARPVVNGQGQALPAFARLASTGPLTYAGDPAPGPHTVAVLLDGSPIGALPVTVTRGGSDDPFGPAASWDLEGPWTSLGVIRVGPDADDYVVAEYWIDPDEMSEPGADVVAVLSHEGRRLTPEDEGGEPIYGSARPWRERSDRLDIEDVPRERAMTRADLRDGAYTLEVVEEGGRTLRTFRFRVEGGAFVPHERSALDYQPRTDFLTPKAVRKLRGQDRYALVDQVWMTAE